MAIAIEMLVNQLNGLQVQATVTQLIKQYFSKSKTRTLLSSKQGLNRHANVIIRLVRLII